MRRLRRAALAVGVVLAVALPRVAAAQAVRLTLHDSASGVPLAGALVGLSTADGRSVAHGVTDAVGGATLAAPPGTYAVRVRRIGQRPYGGPAVTLEGTGTRTLALRVPHVPVSLAAVEVTGRQGCGDASAPEVAQLWDAARTALATVAEQAAGAERAAADDGARAWLVERRLDAGGALLDSAARPLAPGAPGGRPFTAAAPEALERDGYIVGDARGLASFHAPDERALLSDGFVRTHCFAPARGAGPTAEWVGVRFTPVRGRRVADVAGVVWLDRRTGEPRRVEYRYVWARLPREARGLGGVTEFARRPGGEFVVRAWRIRLPRLAETGGRLLLAGYRESGGEIRPPAAAPP